MPVLVASTGAFTHWWYSGPAMNFAWNLAWAVGYDLYDFARGALFEPPVVRTRALGTVLNDVIYIPPMMERARFISPEPSVNPEHALEHAHLDSVFDHVKALPKKNTIVYVATSGAPLRIAAEKGLDNVIARMPFGAMLVAVEQVSEWVRVFYSGMEGYVEIVDLADRAAYVHPKFTIDGENYATDPTTERVRAMIGDEFSYGEGDAPLQAEEYVLYKLARNGVRPSWPSVRPRTAGSWARILRGTEGVRIVSEPSPRAVIEWEHEGKGHVAFIEAVYPDQSIQLSEANWPDRGIYNERVIVQEEWTKLDPTFISFG